MKKLLPIVFLLLTSCIAIAEIQPNSFHLAHVLRVIDGDTIVVILQCTTRERVRLIGVDAPETPLRGEPEFFGVEATNFASRRLLNRDVLLQFDGRLRDRFDRLRAYVWMSEPVNFDEQEIRNKMFNAQLLLGGYARVMTVGTASGYVNFFEQFERKARNEGRGLWKQYMRR